MHFSVLTRPLSPSVSLTRRPALVPAPARSSSREKEGGRKKERERGRGRERDGVRVDSALRAAAPSLGVRQRTRTDRCVGVCVCVCGANGTRRACAPGDGAVLLRWVVVPPPHGHTIADTRSHTQTHIYTSATALQCAAVRTAVGGGAWCVVRGGGQRSAAPGAARRSLAPPAPPHARTQLRRVCVCVCVRVHDWCVHDWCGCVGRRWATHGATGLGVVRWGAVGVPKGKEEKSNKKNKRSKGSTAGCECVFVRLLALLAACAYAHTAQLRCGCLPRGVGGGVAACA